MCSTIMSKDFLLLFQMQPPELLFGMKNIAGEQWLSNYFPTCHSPTKSFLSCFFVCLEKNMVPIFFPSGITIPLSSGNGQG